MSKKKVIKLINNEQLKHNVKPAKACDLTSDDYCPKIDYSYCELYSIDFCYKADYDGGCKNHTEDICPYDYAGCSDGENDICETVNDYAA